MIWALDFDDFNNICGYGKYPISRVMTYTLLASESGVSITPPSTHIPLSTVGTTSRSPHPPPTGDGGKTPDSGGGGSGHDGITSLGNNTHIVFVSFKICCYIGIRAIILNTIFSEKSLYLRIIL